MIIKKLKHVYNSIFGNKTVFHEPPIMSVYELETKLVSDTLKDVEKKETQKFVDSILKLKIPNDITLITHSGLYFSKSKGGFFIYYDNVRLFKTTIWNSFHYGHHFTGEWERSGPWIDDAYEEIKDAYEIYKAEQDEIKQQRINEDEKKLSRYGDLKNANRLKSEYYNSKTN